MYQCGERVVYGIHGVCSIVDIELRTIDRKKVEYYVLTPIDQPDARFYIPTQNKVAVAKIRPLLSGEQLEDILRNSNSAKDCWIADENQRKLKYRELIGTVNTTELLSMVRALYIHREEQRVSGRKFHLCDENFLRDAEKLLTSEISLVLNLPLEEARTYIQNMFHL